MVSVPRRVLDAVHRHVAVPVLTFALPTNCFACRHPLSRFQHLGSCLRCWTGFTPVGHPACVTCALPRSGATDLLGPAAGRCARCVLEPSALEAVRAAVIYDDHARTFLLRAKLAGQPELLGPLGLQVAAIAKDGVAGRCDAVVPVPSHPWMTVRRGFRPACRLAAAVAAGSGAPCRPRWLRVRWGARLVAKRLDAAHRRVHRNVFVSTRRLTGESVLLVDDVMTTGGSLEACARTLLAAGAAEVRAVVWARRLPHR